jgi:hypothetical protein
MEYEIGSKPLPRQQFSSQRKQHRQFYKCCFCIKRTATRPFAGESSFNHGRCRTQRNGHTARQATEGSRAGLDDLWRGNSLHLGSRRVTGGGIVQETITFTGILIGEGQRVECEVRATKTTLDGDQPIVSGYMIVESDLTDVLPDGNYELLVNRDRNRFKRDAGRFFSRPY